MLKLGREKQYSRTFQIDHANSTNIHSLLDSLLEQSSIDKSTLSIRISTLNGGIAGLEYTETKKIRSTP